MEIHKRPYRIYLLLGRKSPAPLFDYLTWQKAATAITPLLEKARGSVNIRSFQIDNNNHQHIPFGRLSWNDSSFQKWTHNSPISKEKCRDWFFEYTSVYCPSWSICVKEDIPPDVFFEIQQVWHPSGNSVWDQEVLLAVAKDIDVMKVEIDTVAFLKGLVGENRIYYSESTWCKSFDDSGFEDFIEAYLQTKIRQVDSAAEFPLPSQLFGEWEYLNC